MTIRLIVNADDYGHTPGVSEGIRQAHLNGIVTTTTTMMNLPNALPALETARVETPRLGVGVHLVLTHGTPIRPADRLKSLLTSAGEFPDLPYVRAMLSDMDAQELKDEWRAQIEAFLTTGLSIDHLDSHHHAACWSEMTLRVLFDLAEEYHVPIRHPFAPVAVFLKDNLRESERVLQHRTFCEPLMQQSSVRYPERMIDDFYDAGVSADTLLRILDRLPEGSTSEVMVHPGIADDEIMQTSTYHTMRQVELDLLTDERVKQRVRDRGIELITFAEL